MTGVDLTGQVAVVTGGRGDIGSAIASALADRGAMVSVADESKVPVAAAAQRIVHSHLDVSDPTAVDDWLDETERELGVPTLVVPAAATATVRAPLEMTADEWTRELAVDLTGPFLVAQGAGRRMVAAGIPGRIVMIGSWAGHAPHQHVPAYSVAKAGLRMLTQILAAELAPHRILVNEVAIGVVDAGVSRTAFAERPELRARSAALAPVGHLVGIDEIVTAVVNLCSPGQRSMAGATILLDGGLSLRTAFTDADGAGND